MIFSAMFSKLLRCGLCYASRLMSEKVGRSDALCALSCDKHFSITGEMVISDV